jgi:hypothetical protein
MHKQNQIMSTDFCDTFKDTENQAKYPLMGNAYLQMQWYI